jgi:hypothetical protein
VAPNGGITMRFAVAFALLIASQSVAQMYAPEAPVVQLPAGASNSWGLSLLH